MKFVLIFKKEYCLLKGVLAFIVSDYDCETVPGVQYLTIDITPVRDETSQSETPNSFSPGEDNNHRQFVIIKNLVLFYKK